MMGRSSPPPCETSTQKCQAASVTARPQNSIRVMIFSPFQIVSKIMVFFLQASPNTQNKIQGKQLMSVTDVPTTVLKPVIGRSTKII